MDKMNWTKFPIVSDERGSLTFIEGGRNIPFEIKRVFYLYGIPGNIIRGNHAHRTLQQILIAISGTFDVMLNDGYKEERIWLNHPNRGLYIPPMTWCEISNFSHDAVCLVLASDFYDETDYIRDFNLFLADTYATSC